MSSGNALDNEDLDNVPLVRMEDVQPRNCGQSRDEVLETCIIDYAEYECVVDDEDSNIGSMVSIQSEEVVECDDNSAELIVPEVLEPTDEASEELEENDSQAEISPKPASIDSWPTLEILPGGVINLADKNELRKLNASTERETIDQGDMMYACAKCSQSFKRLFCLVKHVKWHEDMEKGKRDLTKLKEDVDTKNIRLHSGKKKVVTKTKTRKVPKKS